MSKPLWTGLSKAIQMQAGRAIVRAFEKAMIQSMREGDSKDFDPYDGAR